MPPYGDAHLSLVVGSAHFCPQDQRNQRNLRKKRKKRKEKKEKKEKKPLIAQYMTTIRSKDSTTYQSKDGKIFDWREKKQKFRNNLAQF